MNSKIYDVCRPTNACINSEMESDFIEISGEDDSLLPLPKIPNNDVSTLGNTFFSCSPLHLPRSDRPVRPPLPSRTPVGDENREKLDSLSQRDGVNKENVNVSKPELQKLNMEPQQMKRKKKGGGYNLRKSLAWNRAFFTEEGVLDPLELSMISGDIGKSCGGTLSIIDEDRRESLSGDSENLVSLQENLFKESPSSVANEDSKSSGALLPKNSPSAGVNVASTSAVKRKVLSANDINRSGSKRSGCPRPVASSSLKRPANLNTSKATTKESKVSKVPVPKPDASIISATTKSTILCTSGSKQNQIAQRAVNVQRNTGLKGSLNNSKSAHNNPKSGLASKSMAAKSSVKPAKRNVVSTVSKINSSCNLQHTLVTKANNGLKTNLAPELPASGHSSNNVDGRKSEISLPQNVPCRAGSLQYAQPQNAKPSGLRMPSPSLSFFNQSKPSASHSLLQTNNQACNLQSNISNLRKFGALNTNNEGPIPAPGKIADMVNNVAPTAKLRPPRSFTRSSVPSIFKLDSHEKMSSNLHKNDMRKMPKNLTPKSNSSDIFNQQKLRNPDNDFKQNAEPSKNENISHVGDNEMKSNDKKLLLQGARSDQVMEDENNERVANVYPMSTDISGAELENPDRASHGCPTMQVDGVSATRDMIDNKCIEEKICDSLIKNYGVFSESLYAKSCVPDVSEQSKEQADNRKPYTFQDGHISNKSQRSCINNDTSSKESGSFPEFQKCNNVLIADVNPEVQCCSVSELESSHALIQSRNSEEAKDSVAGVDIFSTKSQVGDGEMQSVSRILSVGIINNILFSSELDNQHIMVVDDASKVVSDSGGSKSKGSCIPSSISPAVKVCSSDVVKTAECLHGDDPLPGSVDALLSCDIKLHDQTTSGESKLMNEDQITATITTGDIQLSNVPESGDLSGCELENLQHVTSRRSAMVQFEVNDVTKTAECLLGDDALLGSVDAQFSCYTKLHCLTTSAEIELMNEDQITAAVTTGDVQLLNVTDSGDFSGCKLENLQHVTSQHSGMVQSEVNDVAKTAECLYGDDALPGSVAEFSYDIKLHGLTTGESEVMSEDQITAAVTTGDIQLSNVPDSGDFSGCELENFQHLQHCAMLQREVNDVAKTAECLHGDDGLPTSIDAEFSYDIKLHGQTTGELGVINEDQITTAVTTGDIRLSNVPDSGDLSGCELENFQHLTSQHSTMEQLEVNDVIAAMQVNGGSDTNEHKGMEDKQYNISEDNHRSDSDLPPDTAYRQRSTSIVHNDGLTFMHIVNSQSEEGVELLFNKGVIFEKSRKLDIGNIADVSPDVKNSRGGSESSHVLFQHEHTEQSNEEIAGFDNTTKKSHIEDAQMLTVDENLSIHSCNCNLWPVKNKSSAFVDGVQEQSGVHTDPNHLSALGSPDSHAFCLNEKITVNNFSSEESPESNVCVSAMDVESSSNVQTRGTLALKNGVILKEQELEYPFEVSDSFDIKTSVETPICYTDSKFRHDDNEFNHAYSMGFDVSLDMSNEPTGVAKFYSSNEDRTLSSAQNIEVNMLESDVLSEEVKRSNGSPNCKMQHGLEGDMYAVEDKDGSVVQDMIFNEYKIDVLPKEAETTTFQKIGGPNSDMKHQLEDTICATDDNEETKLIKSSWSDKKKNDLVIKPPPYAVPFSDEWLAALEAAGEEILTKKSGAVQNSPPEKSLPEPGPWSPVKRKNNQGIGPFDCTKYTNANVNIPPPDSN